MGSPCSADGPTRPPFCRAAAAALALLAGCTTLDHRPRVEWTAAHRTSSLPMDILPSNHIYVAGEVQGSPTRMLIDTGAARTVLDRGFARRLGIEEIGSTTAAGVGGNEPAGIALVRTIRVGSLVLHNLAAITLDLSPIARRIGHEMPMILGLRLFENAVVELDYPRARMVLHRPESFRYRGPGRTVPLRGDELKQVRCQVGDLPPAWFQLDTGSGKALSVFESYAASNRLPDPRAPLSTRLGGGVGGFAPESMTYFDTFSFAGFPLRDVPANFPTPKTGAFADKPFAGNLGGAVLRRFHLWIDFRRSELHVEPGPDLELPFRRDRLGLVTEVRGSELVVLHVVTGSPAQRAGIETGVRITAVDGRKDTASRLRRQLLAASRRRAGTRLHLQDHVGRVYRPRLATRY